jgi:hypothetical protein
MRYRAIDKACALPASPYTLLTEPWRQQLPGTLPGHAQGPRQAACQRTMWLSSHRHVSQGRPQRSDSVEHHPARHASATTPQAEAAAATTQAQAAPTAPQAQASPAAAKAQASPSPTPPQAPPSSSSPQAPPSSSPPQAPPSASPPQAPPSSSPPQAPSPASPPQAPPSPAAPQAQPSSSPPQAQPSSSPPQAQPSSSPPQAQPSSGWKHRTALSAAQASHVQCCLCADWADGASGSQPPSFGASQLCVDVLAPHLFPSRCAAPGRRRRHLLRWVGVGTAVGVHATALACPLSLASYPRL